MTLLIVSIALTLIISFSCSMLEAIILSVTASYIEVNVQKGRPSALILNKLKKEIDRPLAAILTLNTVAHTTGATVIGAQVLTIWGNQYVAVASGLLTFVILIFCEIIPKTIGSTSWKILAPPAAYVIRFLIFLVYPIVRISDLISDILGGGHKHKMTREEVIVTAEMGADQGTLRKKESTIIRNLLMLDNIFAADIMTPRSVILALDANMTVGEVAKSFKPIRYSRIPIFTDDIDHIIGFVHRYEVLEAYAHDKDNLVLKSIMGPIHTVPENISVSAVLDQLIHRNEHIFIVADEYGSTSGIVTLEDAIETLLGVEIVDEFDSVADLREFALQQWKKRKKDRVTTNP